MLRFAGPPYAAQFWMRSSTAKTSMSCPANLYTAETRHRRRGQVVCRTCGVTLARDALKNVTSTRLQGIRPVRNAAVQEEIAMKPLQAPMIWMKDSSWLAGAKKCVQLPLFYIVAKCAVQRR